jgi:hypothetical protein
MGSIKGIDIYPLWLMDCGFSKNCSYSCNSHGINNGLIAQQGYFGRIMLKIGMEKKL